MVTNSTNGSSSIFRDGRLRPGIYKIRNVYTETYVDIEAHSRRVVCRPAKDLEGGRGLWEIKPLGAGYTVQRVSLPIFIVDLFLHSVFTACEPRQVQVEPGEPEQFCTLLDQIKGGSPLSVAIYPVAWRVEIVDDEKHRGFEYIRLCWGTTEWSWAIKWWSKNNGAQVISYTEGNRESISLLMWKLIPVRVDNVEGMATPSQSSPETPGMGRPPSYDEGTSGQSSTRTQHTESERDDFGTIVTEVTTVTTTTRRKYRVEDA